METLFMFAAIVVFLTIVAPIWIIAHYITRWRTAKTLSSEDEKLLAELWESAERMERRINSVERILDTDGDTWRKQG